jgi:hypothetical protein
VCAFCSFTTFLLWFFIQSVDAFVVLDCRTSSGRKNVSRNLEFRLPDFVQVMHYLLTFVILFELKRFGVKSYSGTCYISFLQNNVWFMYGPLNMTLANDSMETGN